MRTTPNDAARLNATHLGDPYANHIAAQLRDFSLTSSRESNAKDYSATSPSTTGRRRRRDRQ